MASPRRRGPGGSLPSRRDRLRVGAVVLGAVAVLAVMGRLLGPGPPASRPGPAPSTTRAPPQRPVRPQPGVTDRMAVGHGGGPLRFGAGGLWVGARRDREVVRIDPGSGRVAARFPVAGRGPVGLAVEAATVWVVRPDADEVVRIDLRTGGVVARIPLGPLPFQVVPGDRRFLPSLVALGAGAGWVATGRGAVARVEATTGQVRQVVPSGLPTGLAAGVGGVWISERDGGGGALACISPGSIPVRVIGLPAVGELAVGGGAVWAADRGGSSVYRIDPGHFPCSAASVLTRPAVTP